MNPKALVLILSLIIYWIYTSRNKTVQAANKTTALNKSISSTPEEPTVNNGLTAPSNIYIGAAGEQDGSKDYFALQAEISGGESLFWWYGLSNGNIYPNPSYGGNGYIRTYFPTHSTNWANGNSKPNVIGKIEYKVFSPNGVLILYVKDTKGGYHPNYGSNLRADNHPKHSDRFLPELGSYLIEFKNISDNPLATMAITWGETTRANLGAGQSTSFTVNVTDWYNLGHEIPKLNCNVY